MCQRWLTDLGYAHPGQIKAHFNQFSNRYCNVASFDFIGPLHIDTARLFNPAIALPSTWLPTNAIPQVPDPLTVDDVLGNQDFGDFIDYIDVRLGPT